MKRLIETLLVAAFFACCSQISAQILYYTSGADVNSVNTTTNMITSVTTISGLESGDYLTGIVQGSDGQIYVVDHEFGNIYRFSLGDTPTLFATVGEGAQAMVFDSHGNLAVGANADIFQVTPTGVVTTLSTSGHSIFGITSDNSGNIYAANYADGGDTSFVTQITSSGTTTTIANINNANGVAYYDGFVYVSTATPEVLKIDLSDNSVSTFSSADTDSPVNLTVNSTGTLFATDNAQRIVSFNSDGSVATTTSTSSTSGATYITPAAVPEPSTWMLFGLGGMVGATVCFRARSSAAKLPFS